MPIEFLPDQQFPMPPSADGPLLTTPGGAWGNSAYGELLASTDADSILTGVVVRSIGTLFTGYAFEVDIAVGAPAAEVPIGTFRGYLQEVLGAVGSEGLYIPTIIGIDNIPNGSRVSARWRNQDASARTLRVSGTYLKKPLSGTLLTTANPLLCLPSSAVNISVASFASPWVTGTPVQVWDDSGPARVIVGVMNKVDQATVQWELDICTGPSDTVVTTLRGNTSGVSSFPNVTSLQHPFVIPALTRMSLQSRTDNAFALNVLAAVSFFEMPL